MEENISKDDLYAALKQLHKELGETTADQLERIKSAGASRVLDEEERNTFIEESRKIIEKYHPLFLEISALASTEYSDRDFTEVYSDIAMEFAYLYGHITNSAKALEMFDMASIRTTNPIISVWYRLSSLPHRYEMLCKFPSYEEIFSVYLIQTTILFLEQLQKVPLKKGITDYISTQVPLRRLIKAVLESIPAVEGSKIHAYTLLAYLYARANDSDESSYYISKAFKCSNEVTTEASDTVDNFISEEVYPWWFHY